MFYRQLAYKLRIGYGPGKPEIISTRPITGDIKGDYRFTDDDNPTLVDLTGEEVGLDLDMLLRNGSIAPWDGETPEKPAAAKPGPKPKGRRRG